MIQRSIGVSAIAALILLTALVGGPAQAAKYRYGTYRGGAMSEAGVFLFLEGMIANPRNADQVVATVESANTGLFQVIPVWDDELAGRVGIGYQWASGNKLWGSYWRFNSQTSALGSGESSDTVHYAVGPPIRTGSDTFVGANGSPGYYLMNTEITAETVDLLWAHSHKLGESLTTDWSLGLRFARFEEIYTGEYGDTPSTNVFVARKSNVGEMIGARAGLRGNYSITPSFGVVAGLAFSLLDGELTAESGLTPRSGGTSSSASLQDDSRSGSILEFDLGLVWRLSRDKFRILVGWEQQIWDGIAADLMRNFPGTSAPLRDRDAVTFSGYKLGFGVLF
jgi:hypothetical protein